MPDDERIVKRVVDYRVRSTSVQIL